MHQANVSDFGKQAEAAFPGAPLEYYSAELMGLIVMLWAQIDDPLDEADDGDLAVFLSGVSAGITYSHPAYGQASCKSATLADLDLLESVLMMRGRLG